MPNQKSRGSMIRPASRGKHFLRRAKTRTTVLASTKARALLMQKRAASLKRQTFQRPISLYRKLGALDHGRSHPEQNRAWKISCVQCRQPTQGASQLEHNSTLEEFEL